MKVLVIDVGGTHVKVLATGRRSMLKIDSGPELTAASMVKAVKAATRDWTYDVISIGYPGPMVRGRPTQDPHNLAPGWVGYNFARAFGKPVRIINDAAMQALGSYAGGRMLFLGLGTGLGTAIVDDGRVEPLEIGHLPCNKNKTYEDYLGLRGLKRMGKQRWERKVHRIVDQLCAALLCDYVVLGGGNARKLTSIPRNATLGDNANAFLGGFRLWKAPKRRGTRRGTRRSAAR